MDTDGQDAQRVAVINTHSIICFLTPPPRLPSYLNATSHLLRSSSIMRVCHHTRTWRIHPTWDRLWIFFDQPKGVLWGLRCPTWWHSTNCSPPFLLWLKAGYTVQGTNICYQKSTCFEDRRHHQAHYQSHNDDSQCIQAASSLLSPPHQCF